MGLNGKAIALALAFMAGVGAGYVAKPIPETLPLIIARPIDIKAISFIQKYNGEITEDEALALYRHIESTIKKYHADPTYQKGVANQITPKLFLALILNESGCHDKVVSKHGAIGLCQVMPLHLEDLEKAGIGTDLLNAENNISAGVHILMGYARNAESLTRALSFYNAGPSNERAGRGYARKVIKLYEEMGG